MSESMSSWKSIASAAASSRISSLKGYLAQQDLKNSLPGAIQRQIGAGREKAGTWKEWAEQKINNRYNNQGNSGIEKIALFPGWATRRYPRVSRRTGKEEEPFEVDVFVSGYATVHRTPDSATRSQRAFIRLAKGFAALPKLEGETAPQDDSEVLMATHMSRSTEELLQSVQLPPRPNEATEDYEVEALERHFRNMSSSRQDSIDTVRSFQSRSSSFDVPVKSAPPTLPSTRSATPTNASQSATTAISDELRKLHANLESRLQPFWSSVLSNRTVRISLFASPQHHDDRVAREHGPVVWRDVVTGPDGSFQARFKVYWEDLCQHPGAVHIAFGEPTEEHDFIVDAELLPPLSPAPNSIVGPREDAKPTATIRVPLTHSPVRVISDIDDTIKYSNVAGGARAVFHNVFVKELKDLVIPGMGNWYSGMWTKGVRFHYVSNGPFEILPLIGEFFEISKLPPGSVKLRSYAGKSLFSGLLSAPSTRKRSGVLDILDGFPDSGFILIGDSGEQDLELYADLAREKPDQILGIFIRDTTTGDPLDDPTGDEFQYNAPPMPPSAPSPFTPDISESHPARWPIAEQPVPRANMRRPNTPTLSIPSSSSQKTPISAGPKSSGRGDYFTSPLTSEPEPLIEYEGMSTPSTASIVSPVYSYSGSGASTPRTAPVTPLRSGASNGSFASRASSIRSGSTSNTAARMTEAERKRYDLQMRVYRARAGVPGHIPLRVFRSPEECVESWTLLDRYFR